MLTVAYSARRQRKGYPDNCTGYPFLIDLPQRHRYSFNPLSFGSFAYRDRTHRSGFCLRHSPTRTCVQRYLYRINDPILTVNSDGTDRANVLPRCSLLIKLTLNQWLNRLYVIIQFLGSMIPSSRIYINGTNRNSNRQLQTIRKSRESNIH